MDIEATIICERDSHKGIIIGKGGAIDVYKRQPIMTVERIWWSSSRAEKEVTT